MNGTAAPVSRADLRTQVERELATIFARSTDAARSHGAEFSRLWELAAQHARGGKLIRPLLLLETYDSLHDPTAPHPPRSEVVRIAAAIEVLHFAFLLHDDVIDGDLIRRGRPNLIGDLISGAPLTSDARHWAQSGGILAGDLLLTAAHQIFARADVDTHTRIRLLDLLEETVRETTAGELVDVGLGDGVIPPELSTVLSMTRRKTAAYTFQLPLRAAVILAGGSPALEARLETAGGHFGLAYQLQDDLLSTFGDPNLHGKDPFSDLRTGKQTAILCFARMTSAWATIEAALGDADLTADAAQGLRSLLTECGAEGFVRDLIDDARAAFRAALHDVSELIPPALRRVLNTLASELEGRCA